MDKKVKRYIYLRDGGKCVHCGKTLGYNQVNIDHYHPKSKGGTDDDFNLVLSCKRCNKYKRATVPKDIDAVNVALLKRAFEDGRLRHALGKAERQQVERIIDRVDRIIREGRRSVFIGPAGKVVIEDNILIDAHPREV